MSIHTDPDQAFEEFWAAYPRHSAKKAARQKFQAALKTGTDPAVIIAGACRYRDDPNRETTYTAMPATWLNQERWLDDPLPPREPTNRPHQADQTRLLTRSQQAAAAAMQAALAERDQQQNNPQDLKQITAQEVPF